MVKSSGYSHESAPLKIRHFIHLLVALSILAFNVASANIYIHRGLERSKVYTTALDGAQQSTHMTVSRSIDKSSAAHHLSLTFNTIGINNTALTSYGITDVGVIFHSIFETISLEPPLYTAFKPPKLHA